MRSRSADLQAAVHLRYRQKRLGVVHHVGTVGGVGFQRQILKLPVRYGQDHRLVVLQTELRHQGNAQFVRGFLRLGPGIVHRNLQTKLLQFLNNVHHAGIAQIRAVFLERQAQHQHACAFDGNAFLDHQLHHLAGHKNAHGVVDPAAGQNHLRVVPHGLGLVRQVVGIYANAVTAHQTGLERQKIPLGAGSAQNFLRVYSQTVKNQRQLVHKGNVHVPLRVFNGLGRLCHPHAAGAKRSGRDDLLVQGVYPGGSFRRGTAGNLADGGQGVHLITGVDALRGITAVEITVEHQAAGLLQHRHAIFFGATGVRGAFVHHHVAGLQHGANGFAGGQERPQVRCFVVVYGRRNRYDVGIAVRQVCLLSTETRTARQRLLQFRRGYLQRAVFPAVEFRHARGVDVKAQHRHVPAERHRQRQPHVAQTDHRHLGLRRERTKRMIGFHTLQRYGKFRPIGSVPTFAPCLLPPPNSP